MRCGMLKHNTMLIREFDYYTYLLIPSTMALVYILCFRDCYSVQSD